MFTEMLLFKETSAAPTITGCSLVEVVSRNCDDFRSRYENAFRKFQTKLT